MSTGPIQRNIDTQFHVTIPNVQAGIVIPADSGIRSLNGRMEGISTEVSPKFVLLTQAEIYAQVMHRCTGNRRRQMRRT